VSKINRTLGLDLKVDVVKECIEKMGSVVIGGDEENLTVEIPPTRSDIMHPCDIAEDVGIAFGYNNIPRIFPPTNTVGK
jgi:phenylalanyl-tRNA synthetase beta chain